MVCRDDEAGYNSHDEKGTAGLDGLGSYEEPRRDKKKKKKHKKDKKEKKARKEKRRRDALALAEGREPSPDLIAPAAGAQHECNLIVGYLRELRKFYFEVSSGQNIEFCGAHRQEQDSLVPCNATCAIAGLLCRR